MIKLIVELIFYFLFMVFIGFIIMLIVEIFLKCYEKVKNEVK